MRLLMTTALMSGLLAPCAFAEETRPATAESTSYISVGAGYVGSGEYSYNVLGPELEADVSSGWGLTGAWGSRSGHWRWEIGASYRDQDLSSTIGGFPLTDNGSMSAISLDLNGYYDFAVEGTVRPYVGAGFGVTGLTIEDGVIDDKGEAVTLQAMAGVSFAVSDRTSLFVEARVQHLRADLDIAGDEEELDITTTGAFAGVRFGL